MDGAAEQAAGPVIEQIADVDEDGRVGVVGGAGREGWDREPGLVGGGEDLEARLGGVGGAAEEEGEGAVVGVGAGEDADWWGAVGMGGRWEIGSWRGGWRGIWRGGWRWSWVLWF